MNDELQKVLAELIGSVIEAKDFLLSELPDVINQLLWWHGVKSGISFVASMTILVLYARAVKWFFSSADNKNSRLYKANGSWDTSDAVGASCILGVLAFSLSICFSSTDWLQILIAPKLYLIEYAAKLVN